MTTASPSDAHRRPAYVVRLIACLCLAALVLGCGPPEDRATVIDFWAMGAEGEQVQQLIADFERQHPGIRVRVQQIPWSSAHEKLLTAYAGDATPDLCQLGNTWIPEFVALEALEELSPWLEQTEAFRREDYFPGIWQTNELDDQLYGIPWYVDTRLMFYRTDILAEAGYEQPPTTWTAWFDAMRKIKARASDDEYAILLPTNEWEQLAILGLQSGCQMLREGGRYGDFRSSEFRAAFEFYLRIFREDLAPRLTNTQISSVWHEFERGMFAMYITGPWNVGEFRRRLSADMQDKWSTAPLPGPDATSPGISSAGGCSLVVFRQSRVKPAAWNLIEFLSQPEQQIRFYELVGNLPARQAAWQSPVLASNQKFQAFHRQLQNVRPMPQVPEWERIARKLYEVAEVAINGRLTMDEALERIDRDVDQILEKRRWLLDRGRLSAAIPSPRRMGATP